MNLLHLQIIIIFLSAYLYADNFTEFIRYEVHSDLSRIVISSETIRGKQAVDKFTASTDLYASKGMFFTRSSTNSSQIIEKVEVMNGHEIKSVISINPPTGSGYGGMVPSCFVQIFFDDHVAVNCAIGYSQFFNMTIPRIVIHGADKSIEVDFSGTPNGKVFNFEPSREIIFQEKNRLANETQKKVFPHALSIDVKENSSPLKLIDEGVYPHIERNFTDLSKGDSLNVSIASPFRIICSDLKNLELNFNGSPLERLKEEKLGDYRYEFK